ncbi:MAG: cadmium-translocating P-type ATPase [Firmicutes bacterium]|nr:cadmium-translocating P-type ATPase [Bacillota bacterium]
MPDIKTILTAVVFIALYIAIGGRVLLKAARNIKRGDVFDENFLMSVASLGSIALGEYVEGLAVLGLYRLGEYLQDRAVDKSRRAISDLMDIRPDFANVERDGQLVKLDPEELEPGQLIVIKPGERVPVDAVITEGSCSLDTSALTGESLPQEVSAGAEIYSGTIDLNGVVTAKVIRPAEESTAARILELVEDAASSRAKSEKFITRFARWYTPAVCGAALLLAVIPSLITGAWTVWIRRALIFLVVSCPCALIISIPLGFFAGIGSASSRGILIKGGNYLEALSKTDTMVFDKTGTLTKGEFKVTGAFPAPGITKERLIETAALAECYSDHPISRSLKEAFGKEPDRSRVENASEAAGHGVTASVDGKSVACGNLSMMESLGISAEPLTQPGTAVYVAEDGRYIGSILISDEVKDDAASAVSQLKALGVRRTVMLTGDRREIAEKTAEELGIDQCEAQLLPQDKLEKVKELKKQVPEKKILAFAGDGINDAPVLAGSDLGIAMGAMGSAAAVEAADVVLMNDRPSDIALAMRISRKTMRIVYQDIVFSIGVKLLVLLLAALGFANMWLAIFADVGVCMIAILNSMRALRI